MNSQYEQIQALLEKNKAAASEITNPLKVVGDGNMLNGVKKLYEHASHEGAKSGFIKGCAATTIFLGACAIGYKGVQFIKRKYEYNKRQKQVGQDIIQALDKNSIVGEPLNDKTEGSSEVTENLK